MFDIHTYMAKLYCPGFSYHCKRSLILKNRSVSHDSRNTCAIILKIYSFEKIVVFQRLQLIIVQNSHTQLSVITLRVSMWCLDSWVPHKWKHDRKHALLQISLTYRNWIFVFGIVAQFDFLISFVLTSRIFHLPSMMPCNSFLQWEDNFKIVAPLN